MSVRKRAWTTSSGERREVWIAAYTDQGGIRRVKTCNSKREADAYEAEVRTKVRAGVHSAPSASPTVAQAAAGWLSFIEGEGREPATVRQYEEHVRLHINPRIGREQLAQLTTPRIHAFRDELLQDLSRSMAKKVLTSLKSVLKDAMRRGDVAQNVALGVSIVISSRDQHRVEIGVDIPSADEVRKLIDNAGRLRPLIMLAAFAGLRASELRGLRWADVDLARGEVAIRQRADRYNSIGKLKSSAGSRVIPVGPMVVTTLKEWRLACPKGGQDLVFPGRGGAVRSYDAIYEAFSRAQVRAGIATKVRGPKYGLHGLRHFFAAWCINRKVDGGRELPLRLIQAQLGHASIKMTGDTYGHLFPRNDDGAELAAAERALLGLRAI
jgi:integrase